MSSKPEVCFNCGGKIGPLETPMIFKDHVVCGDCFRKLRVPELESSANSPAGSGPAKEQVFYECRHHWVFFLRPRVIILSFITFGLALIYYILVFLTTTIVLTNKRIMRKWGIISRDSWELMLRQVSGVNVNRGILDRLVGTGQIVIVSAGGAQETFLAISRPVEFQQKIVDALPE